MNRLKYLRDNLTQADMAVELNLPRETYRNYETGNRQMDNDTLIRVADHFDVTVDYLLGRTDMKKESSTEVLNSLNSKTISKLQAHNITPERLSKLTPSQSDTLFKIIQTFLDGIE